MIKYKTEREYVDAISDYFRNELNFCIEFYEKENAEPENAFVVKLTVGDPPHLGTDRHYFYFRNSNYIDSLIVVQSFLFLLHRQINGLSHVKNIKQFFKFDQIPDFIEIEI